MAYQQHTQKSIFFMMDGVNPLIMD